MRKINRKNVLRLGLGAVLGAGISIFLSGCSKNQNDDDSALYFRIHPSETTQKFNPDEMLSQAQVYCEAGAACPGSVGMLAFSTEQEAGSCTAFLIRSDLAMTNSHCVIDELRKNPELVPHSMRILFPATSQFEAAVVGVEQVLFYSAIATGHTLQGKNPDYALLKLATPIENRGTLELSNEGVTDEQRLTLYSVTPQSQTSIIGSLGVKTCNAMMNSGLQPTFKTPFSSVISFYGCTIMHGNSGSPLVDENNKVRAILHAGFENSTLTQIQTQLQMESFAPVGLATNASCVNLIDSAGIPTTPLNPECSAPIPQVDIFQGARIASEGRATDVTLIEKYKDEIKTKFSNWLEQEKQSPFGWDLKQKDAADYVPTPLCFSERVEDSNEYYASVPKWQVEFILDPEVRYVYRVTEATDGDALSLQFSSKELKKKQSSPLVEVSREYGSSSGVLGICKKD